MPLGKNVIWNKYCLEQTFFWTNVVQGKYCFGTNVVWNKHFWTIAVHGKYCFEQKNVEASYFLILKFFNFHGIFSNSSNSSFFASSNLKSILFILSKVRTIKTKHTMTNVCCLFSFTKLEFFEFSKKVFSPNLLQWVCLSQALTTNIGLGWIYISTSQTHLSPMQ